MWVARNKIGSLVLWSEKPKRDGNIWNSNKYLMCTLDYNLFPDLKWEDEPIEVDLVPHKQVKKSKKTSDEEIEKERNAKLFVYGGEVISWNEIPLHIRKHDYPYFFDEEGNDCYPIKQKH